MPFDVKEPDHIDAMRALHESIVNNDAIPDVGSILDRHLPSQAHKDLLQSAAMREAQMTHEGGSASAFDDSLLGNATKAVQSLPEHTAYKLAGLIKSDDPHELAAGVKFLEDITKGPEAEEYTLTPEQNIGAVKGLARAAATIPENVIGLPADIANAVKDVASWSIKKLPTTANIIRKTWDPEYARAAQYENPIPDYQPAVVKYLDTHEVPLNSDQLVDLARKYNLAPQESSDPWVEAVTNLTDAGLQFTAVPKLYGKLSNATRKLAQSVRAASPDIHAAYYQGRYGVLPKDYESKTVIWTIPKDKIQSPLGKLSASNNADLVPNYAAGGVVGFSKIGAVEKGITSLTKAGKAAQTVQKLTKAEIAAKDAAKAAELAKAAEAEETTASTLAPLPAFIKPTFSSILPFVGDEADIARSMAAMDVYKEKSRIPMQDIQEAVQNRGRLRSEPATTPGPSASEKQWEEWGRKYGVDMRRNPDVPLGVKDIRTGNDIAIPGGLTGKFTIPDLFALKANNFDPSSLTRDQHNKLMQKFMRTHQVTNPDAVDTFNALNFALLSPNAPLTPNEFLQSRFRIKSIDELKDLASRSSEEGLSAKLSKESGVGAAASGGLGVKGTALLGNQADLARLILEKPEMFKPDKGETLRDVTFRVMNQVPGLSQKTASLGVPWLDLAKGNTSAVDLHMIRNNWDKLLDDKQVGKEFVDRMSNLLKVDNTPAAIRAAAAQNPQKVEKAVIGVIGQTTSEIYRSKKTGQLVGGSKPAVSPSKLAYEPDSIVNFGPFYQRIVDYVDASRGAKPVLPLFPEQWRLWDTYRGRVEPHEFAHPDYRKLPKQSFNEMQDALTEHKRVGYTATPREGQPPPSMAPSDWRKLYYGAADPLLLGGIGLTGGLGSLAYKYLNEDEDSGD